MIESEVYQEEMMLDHNQKQKVNVFYCPVGCRLEVVIAKDNRRRSLRLTLEEVDLLIDKLKKEASVTRRIKSHFGDETTFPKRGSKEKQE